MKIMENNEVWKDIKGFEGIFQVSDQGRIKKLERTFITKHGHVRHTKEKILSTYTWQSEYQRVCLYNCGNIRREYVHTLVMESFIGDRPIGYEIDHINRNKQDNRLCNLRYVTRSQNAYNKDFSWMRTEYMHNKFSKIVKKRFEDNEYKLRIVNNLLANHYNREGSITDVRK